MQVTSLPDAVYRERRIAVGMFDGVHRGHRQVIDDADTVLTFDPHPSAIVAPQHAPRLLTPLPVKVELIGDLGVQETIVIPFDRDFAALTAAQFIDEVLVGALGAVRVAAGENFRFGQRAQGDTALIEADGRFEPRIVPLLEVDGEIVSSSHIRSLVLAGEVDVAEHFLGRPFELRGQVVAGDQRGRELGFPTANIVPDDALVLPGHGVYACLAGGRPAAVNVGVRPTFETGRGELVEVHVIDFEGDLYGQELRVEFLARLRGERRFPTPDALIEAMREDIERARAICASATVRGRK